MTTNLLREMNTPAIIGEAFRLYRDHLASLVIMALAPHLALLVLGLALEAGNLAPAHVLAVLLGVTVALNALVLAAMTYAIAGAALGHMPGVGESYRRGFGGRVLWVIAAYMIVWVLITLGFLALVVPGLIIGGLFLPTVPLIVLERMRPLQALSQAVQMMKPHLLRGTVVFAFVVLISGVLPLVVQAFLGAGPLSPLLGAIAGAMTLPLAYSANVVLYFSVRAAQGFGPEQLEEALRG